MELCSRANISTLLDQATTRLLPTCLVGGKLPFWLSDKIRRVAIPIANPEKISHDSFHIKQFDR